MGSAPEMTMGQSNRIGRSLPDRRPITVKKVPADSVAYGTSISHNGRTVWVAESEGVVAVGATASEARQRCRDLRKSLTANGMGAGQMLPEVPK